jgi:hypothetical protein
MHLPVYAGADYHYEDSAWCVHDFDLLDREPPAWDENHWLVRKLDACYDAAKEARGDRGFITPPLMVDPLTCLSMIMTPAELCMALVDRGPRVREWCAALNVVYVNLYERYFQRLGYGESLCFFGPMAEGRSEGVQCDFATMLSPDMFGEFVFPGLNDQCKYMDFALYHHDGVCQLRHLDHLAAVEGLNGIQWNPETTEKDHARRLDAFRDMRSRGLCLYFFCKDVDEGLMLTRELGADGLFLKLPEAKNTDEADGWIQQFEEASGPG